jgi:hypothetical protein
MGQTPAPLAVLSALYRLAVAYVPPLPCTRGRDADHSGGAAYNTFWTALSRYIPSSLNFKAFAS